MRQRLFLVVAVCLAVAATAAAQTVAENESTILFGENSANATLVVVSDKPAFDGAITLELVDTDDIVRARAETNARLEPGRTTHLLALSFDKLVAADQQKLVWYRLRYQVGETRGVISVSRIARDLFDLRVVATEFLLGGGVCRARVRAIDPITQKPVAAVELAAVIGIEARDDGPALTLEGAATTDADGFAIIDVAIPSNLPAGGSAMLSVVGRKNGLTREASGSLQVPADERAFMMLTDKRIYQPGQIVNARGLLFKGIVERVVAAGEELEFRVTDEDSTELFRQRVRTSDFGVAATAWTIPDNVRLGTYNVTVYTVDDNEAITSMPVSVARYELPKFTVRAKAVKSFYLPTDAEAEVEVSADYLFGKPVTKGRVRVVRESEREWNWKEQKWDTDEGEAREGTADANGKFRAAFRLADDFDDLESGDLRFRDLRFAAYFTDLTTNRTEQRRFDVRISREPIHVYFIGNRYDNSSRLPVEAHVSTFYADGTPASCDVVFKVREADSDAKFSVLKTIATNSFGAGKLEFRRPESAGEENLEYQLIARDKNGRLGTEGVGEDMDEEIDFDDDAESVRIRARKTILRPGEPIEIEVVSTAKSGLVYIDVADGLTNLESRVVSLADGRVALTFPYRPSFRGGLKISAIVEGAGDDPASAVRNVIFPAPENLTVGADFDQESYRPGADAKLGLDVREPDGKGVAAALGVAIVDKAVDERTRTDTEFGESFRNYDGWLGYTDEFGAVSLKDIEALDTSKPIDDGLQIAAEILLDREESSGLRLLRGSSGSRDASWFYKPRIRSDMSRVAAALREHFRAADFDHPTDDASLRRILRGAGIDFDALRDPWDRPFRASLGAVRNQDVVRVTSSGPDKVFGTGDDLSALDEYFEYFNPTGATISKAVEAYHARTGGYVRDLRTLLAELGKPRPIDRWGQPYRFIFDVAGRDYTILVRSAGPDGKFCDCRDRDDFDIWTKSMDFFKTTEAKIRAALAASPVSPRTEAQFKSALANGGIDFGTLRDGFGNPLYLAVEVDSRYAEKFVNGSVVPVTQAVSTFSLKSIGRDRRRSTSDDLTFSQFRILISERGKDGDKPAVTNQPVAYRPASASISGLVRDANGVGIANSTVTVTNSGSTSSRVVLTNEDGRFFVGTLEPGTYSVTADAPGFKRLTMSGIVLSAGANIEVTIALEVGTVSATVSVSSSAPTRTTNAAPADAPSKTPKSSVTGFPQDRPTSTPRLREYFPETLFWAPEIVTDENGKASVNLKFADNITTWRLFAIASTKSGKLGVAEREIKSFQPFFVDLDPPMFLTDGDEIFLPTQVRNYTPAKQKVGVTMSKSDWFSFIGPDFREVEVAKNASANAVFGFKAVAPAKNGKQRVTAVAKDDSDAIEKPVTVRPNGFEVVRSESKLFAGAASLGLDFPANALAGTTSAELKIYPNPMSHVAEAINGLLMRPYGCGEQTISSTYPNLMIIRFADAGADLKREARKYLQTGYEKLLGYQLEDGGFSYWGAKDSSDVALTAYALRFLTDASRFIDVDPKVVKSATGFLVKRQRADGAYERRYSWENSENTRRTKLDTSYVARTLAMVKASGAASGEFDAALAKSLDFLKERNKELDEPYTLALYALASFDAGRVADAEVAVAQLKTLGKSENDGVYWSLETNTPFYGWGTAGRIETTALVLQSLMRSGKQTPQTDDLISKATIFLLRSKDRFGVWHSTQTTINVLDALIASFTPPRARKITIASGGETIGEFDVPADRIAPLVVDLGKARGPTVEITGANGSRLMAQVVRGHYVDWKDAAIARRNVNESRAVEMNYTCDKTSAKIMETITCRVAAERVGFRGYGMLLAEIGIPPGAEVSRESLEKALAGDSSLSRYEIRPDRIVVYMWAKPGGTKFGFTFKPRYAIKAKTPASFVYDYYNEEAKATVAPLGFEVR